MTETEDTEAMGVDPTGSRTPEAVEAARALLASPGFTATGLSTERQIITLRPRIESALTAYAAAYGSHPGRVRTREAARAMSEETVQQRETALAVLTDALEIEMVIGIREALTLAGVTDPAVQDDLCRRVLDGD